MLGRRVDPDSFDEQTVLEPTHRLARTGAKVPLSLGPASSLAARRLDERTVGMQALNDLTLGPEAGTWPTPGAARRSSWSAVACDRIFHAPLVPADPRAAELARHAGLVEPVPWPGGAWRSTPTGPTGDGRSTSLAAIAPGRWRA
jgi:hypothetical protein